MPYSYAKQESRMMTEYMKLLGKFSLVLVLGAILCGVIATYNYKGNAQTIEGITHRDLDQKWTTVMLWIPLILQVLVLGFLSARVWKHMSNETIRHYFKFYFLRTFFSSFIYVVLWWRYTAELGAGADKDTVYYLSWLSLGGIVLLIYIVVQATYLITRSSFRNNKRLFTEKDIKESQHKNICEQLKAASQVASTNQAEASTKIVNGDAAFLLVSANNTGAEKKDITPQVQIIHEWMLKDRDYKVHRVAYKGAITDLDISHLIEALNRLVCSRSFYSSTNENARAENIPLYIIETSNREYIQEHLLKENEAEQDYKTRWEQLKEKGGSLLGGQKRADKRIGQRRGIAMFPFYTMVFFFSIFLCIAYLFGFAFAFEDKYVQLSNTGKHVSLFMSDDLLEDPEPPSPGPSPMPVNYALNELQKVFYFDPGEAGIKVEKIENVKGDKNRYVAQINQDSLEKVIREIKVALDAGKSVRVELIGRADDKAVSKVTYASNYEVALARIKSVRFLLQQKLIEESMSTAKLAAIDWIETSFSNDESLAPKRRKKNINSIAFLVVDDRSAQLNTSDPKEIEQLIQRLKEDNLKMADSLVFEEVSKLWERVDKSAQEGLLRETAIYELYYDIRRWIDLMSKADTATEPNVRDKIERQLYQLEDLKGSQRAVEVYLHQSTLPQIPLLPESQPHSKRMALMDYLYFAMYTITTTGYGDIKPMTPYTKFLCTLANITEFFFIVVFFNTLLSLRRGKEEITWP